MHVSIRRYRGVDADALAREIERDFAPRLRRAPGFAAYYVMIEGADGLTTVSVFSTAAMAAESDAIAADWMRERDQGAPLEPVDVSAGRLAFAAPPIRG
ncbi:MAG: hypothetical protein ACFCUS_14040 [Rubrimonas sp.]|uniref:hypothetical protein n=1 Tax=Rubrimonas sp. TaxID=2036015 RepID=UPI002FDEBBB3